MQYSKPGVYHGKVFRRLLVSEEYLVECRLRIFFELDIQRMHRAFQLLDRSRS